MLNKIKYTVSNQTDETVINATIEYIKAIQDFRETNQICDVLRKKYRELGYNDDEIETWITCDINIGPGMYAYSVYAYAKTQHGISREYIRNESINSKNIVSSEYTKNRNVSGQQILDALKVVEDAKNVKKAIEENIIENLIKNEVFFHNGKDYMIVEKEAEPDEN